MNIKRNKVILYFDIILLIADTALFVHSVHKLMFMLQYLKDNKWGALLTKLTNNNVNILWLVALLFSFLFFFSVLKHLFRIYKQIILERYMVDDKHGLYIIYSFMGYRKDFIPWYSITGIDIIKTPFDRLIGTCTIIITNVAIPRRMKVSVPFVLNCSKVYNLIQEHINNNLLQNNEIDYDSEVSDKNKEKVI